MSILNPRGYLHYVVRYRTGGPTLGVSNKIKGTREPGRAAKCRCGWESKDLAEIEVHEALATQQIVDGLLAEFAEKEEQ